MFRKLNKSFLKKMCNGMTPEKMSKHWRLSQVFYRIHINLQTLRTVNFVHVKRKENMFVDCLVNEGVISKGHGTRHVWESIPPGKMCDDCLCQATKYIEHFHTFSREKEKDKRKAIIVELLALWSLPISKTKGK